MATSSALSPLAPQRMDPTTQRRRLRRNPTHLAAELAAESCSTASVVNSVLAGYAAGVSGTVIGHPMDSLKVWLQTNRNPTTASRIPPTTANSLIQGPTATAAARSMSTLASTTSSLAPLSRYAGTVRALYSGISGPLVTVGLVQSINFAVYDSCRRMLYALDHPTASSTTVQTRDYLNHDSLSNVALSSMAAGSVLACFTSPMLIVKTQQQVQGYSFRQAVKGMLRPAGSTSLQWKNAFVGFGLHSFSEIAGRAVYFVTYEHLKRQLLAYRQANTDASLKTVSLQDRMLSAAASGIMCWAAIFPIDAIRCRLYAQTPGLGSQSTAEMARTMYQAGGWRTFYRGFGVTVLRAGPVAAAVLPIYDLTLETLSSSN